VHSAHLHTLAPQMEVANSVVWMFWYLVGTCSKRKKMAMVDPSPSASPTAKRPLATNTWPRPIRTDRPFTRPSVAAAVVGFALLGAESRGEFPGLLSCRRWMVVGVAMAYGHA
jgi:hypothetical protein